MNFVKSEPGYTNLELVTLVVDQSGGRCLLVGAAGTTIDTADLDAVLPLIDPPVKKARYMDRLRSEGRIA
jgi:hypothetical protein